MAPKIPYQFPKFDYKPWKSGQGAVSLATFLVAAFLLGIAVGLGLILVTKVFLLDSQRWAFLKEIGLGFLYPANNDVLNVGEIIILGVIALVGMIVGLISTQIFNNQALPKIVSVYVWLCSAFSLIVYVKIAFNLYTRKFVFETQYPKYLLAILVVMAAVYILPLLYRKYQVVRFSIPIFIGNFIHLLFMLARNIFQGSGDLSWPLVFHTKRVLTHVTQAWREPETSAFEGALGPDLYYFLGDILLFFLMVYFAISMVRNAPIIAGIKRRLDANLSNGD